jgi:hypothetical protein
VPHANVCNLSLILIIDYQADLKNLVRSSLHTWILYTIAIMATSEPQPSSKEPDFGKLIEDYFSLERQRSTFVPSQSIEEMRCMVRNYSAILQTSKDVLDQVEEHGEIICASDVIKKIETALQWQNCQYLTPANISKANLSQSSARRQHRPSSD